MWKYLFHITLIASVLLSTLGIHVHQHYCQEELKNVAFWTMAENCHSNSEECPMHPSGDEEKDCCDDRHVFEEADIDLFVIQMKLPPDLDQWSATTSDIFNRSLGNIDRTDYLKSPCRPPPKSGRSLRILYDSFLC